MKFPHKNLNKLKSPHELHMRNFDSLKSTCVNRCGNRTCRIQTRRPKKSILTL